MISMVGYARSKDKDEYLEDQKKALFEVGCKLIYKDIGLGVKAPAKGLDAILSNLNENDLLVVHSLDRLGRSMSHSLAVLEKLYHKKLHLWSLKEDIKTSKPGQSLKLAALLHHCEKIWVQERTRIGLSVAKEKGLLGGRPNAMNQDTISLAKSMYTEAGNSITSICKVLQISRPTFYKYIKT